MCPILSVSRCIWAPRPVGRTYLRLNPDCNPAYPAASHMKVLAGRGAGNPASFKKRVPPHLCFPVPKVDSPVSSLPESRFPKLPLFHPDRISSDTRHRFFGGFSDLWVFIFGEVSQRSDNLLISDPEFSQNRSRRVLSVGPGCLSAPQDLVPRDWMQCTWPRSIAIWHQYFSPRLHHR